MEPVVALSHFDNPQVLEDLYEGWLSTNMSDDFATYADFCFETFGNQVRYWITFNEIRTSVIGGYL